MTVVLLFQGRSLESDPRMSLVKRTGFGQQRAFENGGTPISFSGGSSVWNPL